MLSHIAKSLQIPCYWYWRCIVKRWFSNSKVVGLAHDNSLSEALVAMHLLELAREGLRPLLVTLGVTV